MRRLFAVPVWLALGACGRTESPVAKDAEQPATTAPPPSIRYDQHIAVEGTPPAGAQLANPFAGDVRSASEGGKFFISMNCEGCHGAGGTGSIAPSLSDGRWRYGASDGAIYQSIYYGRPQGMPAYGGVLQEPIIWRLVTYLKSLPVPAAVPTQAW